MATKKMIAIAVSLQALVLLVNGQVQEQLTPIEMKQRTIVTEPQTQYKGFFRAGLALNYSTIDKIFDEKGDRVSLESNIWANAWFFQTFLMYGITNRLQVEVMVPYRFEQIYQSVAYEAPDQGEVGVSKWKTEATGLSDLHVTVAYQLLTETEIRPSITAFVTGLLPTGEKNFTNIKSDQEFDKPVGSGEPSVNTVLRLRKVHYPFSYSVFGSYEVFFGGEKILDPADTEEKPFQSGNNFSVGGYFNFHLNDWIAIRNSLDYFFSLADEYDGVKEEYNSWVFQYYPGISFQIKQFRIDQAVTIPLFGKSSAADPSYFLIVQYTF
ncbi:MAG: hypothetical protein WAZ98_06285 [Cyclobacteriaceae bacterium]